MNSIRWLKGSRLLAAGILLQAIMLMVGLQAPGQTPRLVRGVPVSFRVEAKMFPRSWYRKKIQAAAIPLPAQDTSRVLKTLSTGLSKYPEHFAARYLQRVYVLRSLWFYGLPYGGTYSKKRIYLSFESENSTNTDLLLEQRLHHEFSSILWRENRKRLDLRQWNGYNARGFEYGEGGTEALSDGLSSLETDPGYFNIGFLNRYAMADIEQDINVMAQNLFAGGPEFWKIVDANARIRGKTMLLIGFYHSLDPVFTEQYFRGFLK